MSDLWFLFSMEAFNWGGKAKLSITWPTCMILGSSIQVNGPYIFMAFCIQKLRQEKVILHWPLLQKRLRKQNSIFCPELLSWSIEIYDSKKMLISLPSFCLSLSRFQSKSKLDLKTTWHLPSYLHILHIIIFSNFPNSGWSLWRNKYIFCIYHLSSEP